MQVDDLSDSARSLLAALTSAALACQSPDELAQAAGLDDEATTDGLVELDLGGWIQSWDTIDGTVLTLTPLAVEVLHVHLVEWGPDEVARWQLLGDPLPPLVCSPQPRTYGLAGVFAAVDPEPGPLEHLIQAEENPGLFSVTADTPPIQHRTPAVIRKNALAAERAKRDRLERRRQLNRYRRGA